MKPDQVADVVGGQSLSFFVKVSRRHDSARRQRATH